MKGRDFNDFTSMSDEISSSPSSSSSSSSSSYYSSLPSCPKSFPSFSSKLRVGIPHVRFFLLFNLSHCFISFNFNLIIKIINNNNNNNNNNIN